MEPEKKLPRGLKTAEEMEEIIKIPAQRIRELAEAGYMPHWLVDGNTPLFQVTKAREWVAQNIVRQVDGAPLPTTVKVMVEPPRAKRPPKAIAHIENLRELTGVNPPPGIYFLVWRGQIMYIGQSVNPYVRIATHAKDGKAFTRAYFLPVPRGELDAVEGALIRALKPRLNGRGANGGVIAPTEVDDEKSLARYAPHLVNEVKQAGAA